jgi:hypothetical protein
MEIDVQTNWKAKLSRSALNSLDLNERRIVDGSDSVVMNPAYEEKPDDEIKGMIEEILSKHHLTDKLREIEDSNCSKFGPRSIAKPWKDRKQSLLDYFENKNDHDPGGFERTTGRLIPATAQKVADNLLKSSSAGLPYMQRKGIVLRQALANWKIDEGQYPCVLYTRTQTGGKTRNVWGFPVSDTIAEQRYFMPMLCVEKTFPHRAALLGPEHVDAEITRLLMTKAENEVSYCVDFSAFDSSITPQHAYRAFQQLALHFQNSFLPEFYEIYRKFATIGIHTPEGTWSGPHGVPSGSSFTNTVDSMVQYLVAQNLYNVASLSLEEYRDPVDEFNCQIQGDDGFYIVPKTSLDLLTERFKTAGLNINESKSDTFETKEAVYLQRYYHPDYKSRLGGLGGVYSIYRAFNRIKYLERWTDIKKRDMEGSDFFSLRTVTILENCKHHPGFEDAVRLAHRLDRKNLAFSKQGLAAYSRDQESKVRAGVFNQYGLQRGIHKFETIKILKTL